MSDSFRSVPDPVARFFDNYLICLDKASVPKKQRRWYVRRVEAFIKAHSGRKIKTLTSHEAHEYLDKHHRIHYTESQGGAKCKWQIPMGMVRPSTHLAASSLSMPLSGG